MNKRLESFNFSRNQLVSIPADLIHGLPNLKSVNFSSNKIVEVPADFFAGATSVTNVHFGANYGAVLSYGNQISKLDPDVFRPLVNVEELYLNMNKLAELPAGIFDGLTKLKGITLANNKITVVPDQIFKDSPDGAMVNLYQNPISLEEKKQLVAKYPKIKILVNWPDPHP